MLLGGRCLRERGLVAAARIATVTGSELLAERHSARLERGAGLPVVERLPYWPELVSNRLAGLEHLILADANAPVSLFAYPGRASCLVPAGCEVHDLSTPTSDVLGSLEQLVAAVDAADAEPPLAPRSTTLAPSGQLTAEKVCQAIGSVLPEGAIVSDESITSGAALASSTAGAPRHDWLTLTGGAIGQGLPVAVGAAIACPDRPVIALEADGSAMYTIQSLWTMAREQLDVTVVILNNRSYSILDSELARLDEQAGGPRARALLDLSVPALDFVDLGRGLGVPSSRADTAEQLTRALVDGLADSGPHLIDAVIPAASTPSRAVQR
jgi:acetolactate synthase-1/2/3 large subunit